MSTIQNRKLSFPRLCALLADRPTKLSQAMHNAGYRSLNINYSYVAIDTTDTHGAIAAMRTLGIRGYSLTIPHKEHALACVDKKSKEVEVIGACNTIVNDTNTLTAYNTDCDGIELALQEAGLELKDKNVLILGAGGASRAAIYSCQKLGAKAVAVANRNAARLSSLTADFQINKVSLSALSKKDLEGFDLLINSTPVGSMLIDSGATMPIDHSLLNKNVAVFDMVTRFETPLLRAAKSLGAKTISGPRMLLFQAVKQFELFTELKAPVDAMAQALENELA